MGSLGALMGPLYAEMEPAILLDRTAHKTGLAVGVGRRIWSFNELPEKAKLQCDIMQKLSGRDKLPVKAQSRQVLAPRQKCIVSTNHLPELGTVNDAIDQRLLVVRFPVVFKNMPESEVESEFVRRADSNLKQRVEENLPVLLKWLVEGAVRWYSDPTFSFKAQAPLAVQQATKEYIDKYDTLVPFVRARCARGKDLKVTTCDLLEAYNAYYHGSSRKAIGARELAEMMRRDKEFQPAENIGRKSLNGYSGLSLK